MLLTDLRDLKRRRIIEAELTKPSIGIKALVGAHPLRGSSLDKTRSPECAQKKIGLAEQDRFKWAMKNHQGTS